MFKLFVSLMLVLSTVLVAHANDDRCGFVKQSPCGDLNGDGAVTVTDQLAALKILVGRAVPAGYCDRVCSRDGVPMQASCYDVNSSGSETITDVGLLARVVVGLADESRLTCPGVADWEDE